MAKQAPILAKGIKSIGTAQNAGISLTCNGRYSLGPDVTALPELLSGHIIGGDRNVEVFLDTEDIAFFIARLATSLEHRALFPLVAEMLAEHAWAVENGSARLTGADPEGLPLQNAIWHLVHDLLTPTEATPEPLARRRRPTLAPSLQAPTEARRDV